MLSLHQRHALNVHLELLAQSLPKHLPFVLVNAVKASTVLLDQLRLKLTLVVMSV
jgi:hypothetical protein